MMHIDRSLLAAILVSAVLSGGAAMADPRHGRREHTGSTGQPNLGGGFIEFLVTGRGGRATAPQPRAQALPVQYGAPGQDLPMEPPQRSRTQVAALPQEPFRQVEQALDPKYLPQVVDYGGPHRAGTIVIDTPNKFLYLVEGNGKARRYGIGVGRPGFEWAGAKTITRKSEWPDWRPPPQMLQRRPDLPRYMPGGPENPMGARGLYLGSSLYRIHGTNEPHTIGQAVSSGCIRMRNEDVTDLYERVRVGTRVIVM
jgi:lipoprotein-anchoring transpeptidase ErfK/SrfK